MDDGLEIPSLDIGLEIQPCGLAAFSVGGPVKPPYHTVGFRQFLPFFQKNCDLFCGGLIS